MSFNLSVILRESAGRHPDAAAVVHDGGVLTYRQLDELSDHVAAHLVAAGLGRGQGVGLQMPNVPEFVVTFYGVLKAGGFVIPMNTLNKAPEIAYFLERASADIVVTDAACAGEAVAGAALAGSRHVFVRGAGRPDGTRDLAELLAPGERTDVVDTEPGDTAVVLYTSGTTGRPKGVQLTHFGLYMNADAHRTAFAMHSGSVVVAVMPLFHALGLSGLLNPTVLAGGTLRLLERFDPTRLLQCIQDDGATLLHGVPTMYHALLEHPDRARFDTSSLTTCGSAGAAIAAELLDRFEQELGVPILEMYGLTECSPLATFNAPDDRKPYSVGKAIWGTELQIWDVGHHRLPAGREHVGEIVLRGHHTMGGYLDDADATAEAFGGGWLHTGDLGYVDEDGFLFIVGRKKELIIRGGYNVYPREVEEVLARHPAVDEVAVVGRPHDRLGEEVAAFVSVRAGFSVQPQEIIEFVKERVAAYKYPRTVTFLAELPKGPTGKVLKRSLIGG